MKCSARLLGGEHKWEILRTIWPYKEGWGIHCVYCKMITDTGIKKRETCELIVKQLEETINVS